MFTSTQLSVLHVLVYTGNAVMGRANPKSFSEMSISGKIKTPPERTSLEGAY
jgi:hypothetical protein